MDRTSFKGIVTKFVMLLDFEVFQVISSGMPAQVLQI